MGKRGKNKSNRQDHTGHFDRLAELKQDEPVLSAIQADQLAVDAAVEAFFSSALVEEFKKLNAAKAEADEMHTQVRTLSRQSEELATALSMAKREKSLKDAHLRRINEQKVALKADAKNKFLAHPKIAEFKAMILAMRKNFQQATDEFVLAGLASDATYQGLEAEALLVNKSAEKLAKSVASLEKKQGTLERKITRLQAEVGKLDAAAKLQKEAIYG